jgi:quinol monooxygenase YgiN
MVGKAGAHAPGGKGGTMYGTVIRCQLPQGLDAPLEALGASPCAGVPPRPGYLGRYAYRLPEDPDGLYLVELFASRAASLADAAHPANARSATPGDWHAAGAIVTYRRGD